MLEAAGVTAAHDGEPLDEPMVAGLAGGIGFMYFSFSYAGHLPTMTIVPRIHPRPFLAGALERAGIAHRSGDHQRRQGRAGSWTPPSTPAQPDLHRRPRPGCGHQTWADAFAGAAPYDVAVAGAAGTTCCSTTSVWSRSRSRPRRSRPPAPAHRKSRHRMVVVEPGARPVDLVPAIRAALAVTVHDLTEDVMPGNFAGNFGLRGLAKWADAVADRRGPRAGAGCSTAAPRSAPRCAGCTTA